MSQGTPQFSDDRQWWWNGTEWRPASEYGGPNPAASAPPPPATAVAPVPPRKRRNRLLWGCGGLIALVVLLGICVAAANSASGPKTGSTARSTATPTSSTTANPTTAATTAPKSQFVVIHDGNWRVGQDVQPGTYRTRSGSSGCYFARLKGFSGQLTDIAANDNTDAPAVVTIDPADKGFQSRSCATWTSDLSAITKSRTTFGEGDYMVGTDIQPGTYRSNGTGDCYYARLNNFAHELGSVIANDNTTGPAVVTIAPGDKGFESARCGTWSPG